MPIQVTGGIYSKKGGIDQIDLLGRINEVQFIANYNGVLCIAYFIGYPTLYFVDDKYSILPADWEKRFCNESTV